MGGVSTMGEHQGVIIVSHKDWCEIGCVRPFVKLDSQSIRKNDISLKCKTLVLTPIVRRTIFSMDLKEKTLGLSLNLDLVWNLYFRLVSRMSDTGQTGSNNEPIKS